MLGEFARILLAVVVTTSTAAAAPITLSGSQGPLSASATIELLGPSSLRVTLTNTSTWDVAVPSHLLTALFFNLPGDPALTPVSALLAAGSTVLFGSAGPGGVVGGEWAYAAGLTGAPWGARQGVSSVGLGLFGPHDLFPGANLAGPESPNGDQYGITSAGDDPAVGNWPVTGKDPLILNAVTFTLNGLPDGFLLRGISDVSFQYGSALSDPNIPAHSPEPGSLALVLLGIGLLAGGALRRKLCKRTR
jgi:hypothetical protein